MSYYPIDPDNETAMSLEKISQGYIFQQFKKIVEKAIAEKALLPTTENGSGRYVSRVQMEAMKEIKAGDDVRRKIRAFWFPPYHGAFMMVDGVKCTQVSEEILTTLAEPSVTSLLSKTSGKVSDGT